MYIARHDDERGIAVWRFVGAASPEDWARHMSDMERVARWKLAEDRPSVLLEVFDFTPNAGQRAEIAKRRAVPTYRPHIAFVTTSAVLRGTLKAISWLQAKKHYDESFFPDAESGMRWLEEQRRSPIAALRTLRSEIERSLRTAV